LAVLSSLAERPERIAALFFTTEINSAGCYLVYFYVNGIKTPVIVDDYLPVDEYGRVAFASSKDGEIWTSLLEKAWAKLHGSYARIEGGVCEFAYSQLCGVPGTSTIHEDALKDPDSFWQELKHADSKNFVMLAASHGQGEAKNQSGIISGHAYSLI
jgi:calpain-15